MRRILPLLLALTLLLPCIALAQTLDVAAMTDEELRAMYDLIGTEIDRRAAEARAEAARVASETDSEGEIIYQWEEGKKPQIIFASEDQLYRRLHKVELTMENWNQYLGDYYYPHQFVQTNNFGEVTKTTESRAVGFHFKEGYICQYVDVGLKFTGKRTYRMDGEWNEDKTCYSFVADEWKDVDKAHTVDLYNGGLQDVHLEKYECTAVTGTLYVLEVAPEASRWILASRGAVPWVKICVGDEMIGESDGLKNLYNKLNP